MSDTETNLTTTHDGTSQAQRLLSALQTDYALIDGRSLLDQLALAQQFAQELKYFDLNNVAAGDWQKFINPDTLNDQDFSAWLQRVENFIQQPENYPDDVAANANLRRPHFVLFLTFLQLLKNTQAQLNLITARHLDFYYRQVLDFQLQPAQPDHVNILVTPASQVDSALLPAGTLLAAGQDSQGKDLVYSTDTDLVVNHIQVARLSSIYVNRDDSNNWLGLSAYTDTTSVKSPDSKGASRWYTFGQRQADKASNSQIQTSNLGWAISSPILCLSQGTRIVTLTQVFDPGQFTNNLTNILLTHAFSIQLSTTTGWMTASNFTATIADFTVNQTTLKSLVWTINIDATAPAITALPGTDSSGINALWPILRLMLQPDTGNNNNVTKYAVFKDLSLKQVLLAVDAKGLVDCKLQNDNQSIPPGKPFEPFGASPAIGSRLNFTHPELMLKTLDSLEVKLQWMGLPNENFKDFYANYPAVIAKNIVDNKSFTCQIAMVDQHLELTLSKTSDDLFVDTSTTIFSPADSSTLTISDVGAALSSYNYERRLAVMEEDDITGWPRYWCLELNGCDFQHSAYPAVAAAKATELAVAISKGGLDENGNKIVPDNYKVNPPYTPKLKSFSVNYTASLTLTSPVQDSQAADQIFHWHPFGYSPMPTDPSTGGYKFLPEYGNQAELYLGLCNVNPPQTLSILLQMAEGTANPDTKATVAWSILDGNVWKPVDQGQLLQDGTNGLLQSGILRFQLNPVAPSTLLPPGLYWLRAAATGNCDSLCDTISIDTQAVSATFLDQDNSDDHLNQPLPANTIQSLVSSRSDIATISQPYTSFGAKPKEQESGFYTRISERLRHKQRAISHWDYERLVLAQFPDIYKVKCIPAGVAGSQDKTGQVNVIVIPDIRKRLPFNPFEPKAPSSVLDTITSFLKDHAAADATIMVKNPNYQPVKLRFGVKFQDGCDSGFYKHQLNEEVNCFLSPWAYDQGEDIVIGGYIYANSIIDFIERRPYVDYVEKFKLFLVDEDGNHYIAPPHDKTQGYAVAADQNGGVLVADKTHVIDVLSKDGKSTLKGINYMMVGLDFVVGDTTLT
jgi:hypothetical protein